MKYLFFLFLISFATFEYTMERNVRPLVAAARNREMRRPHPAVRQIIIARFMNGRWYERVYTKELNNKPKGPFLKHPELETHVRVKRSKPWQSN